MHVASSLPFHHARSRTAIVGLVAVLCLLLALLGFAGSGLADSRGHTPDGHLMAPMRWYQQAQRTA